MVIATITEQINSEEREINIFSDSNAYSFMKLFIYRGFKTSDYFQQQRDEYFWRDREGEPGIWQTGSYNT